MKPNRIFRLDLPEIKTPPRYVCRLWADQCILPWVERLPGVMETIAVNPPLSFVWFDPLFDTLDVWLTLFDALEAGTPWRDLGLGHPGIINTRKD